MAITSKLTITRGKLSPFAREVTGELEKRVAIGFPAGGPSRQPEPGEEAPPSNAAIAYLQERGAPDQNLPARPFLVPGVESIEAEAVARLKKAAAAALAGDLAAPERALNAIGLQGVSAVRERITEGAFAPLSERTLQARKARGRTSEKPLIDTSQMRAAVTYVITNGNIRGG
jgi:hypothetical protein